MLSLKAKKILLRPDKNKTSFPLSVIEVHHHTFAYGATHALSEYLLQNAKDFTFVEHPFMHHKFRPSTIRFFYQGSQITSKKAPAIRAPETILFLYNIITTCYLVLKTRRKFDLFFGADPLNAFAGILLRALGRVRKVVFYVIDYTPKRFSNTLKNKAYQLLLEVVAKHVDSIWAISEIIARECRVMGAASERVLVVPSGACWRKELQMSNRKGNALVFLGHLVESKGLQLAIEAIQLVKLEIPDIRLTVIGTGPYENELKSLVCKLGLNSQIEFLGYVKNHSDILDILAQSDIGIAPYVPSKESITTYADPAKIKEYLGSGLAVIVTCVPMVASEISKKQAGITINYSREELAKAIIALLKDEKLLLAYKKNALAMAHDFTWDQIFELAIAHTLNFCSL